MSTRIELANAIRALSMDAVQRANSGHPGMPMGMADIAEVLWNRFLRHHPANPDWPNRDRFVLSNGHGSMLHYALLHLSGYALPIDEIKNFRQLHSMTPGHPERGYAPGVETTTGPLGQGLANAVGMAIAERSLAAHFNRPGHDVVDHDTYVFVGDGCLMEGISHEVCSLAGTLGLGKLIAVYDDNGISIDGPVGGWFTDATPERFHAYGWQVIDGIDGHDPDAVEAGLKAARAESGKPSLLCCKTIIGWGAPNKQGTAGAHGAALGDEEVALARETLDWPHPAFVVPDEIYAGWNACERGQQLEQEWLDRLQAYRGEYPELAVEFERRASGALPAEWAEDSDTFVSAVAAEGPNVASRKASQNALESFAPRLPELIGGSADLTGSNLTLWSGSTVQSPGVKHGNYIYFGVREFGMSAIMNGLALHGGFIPYGATFLMFSEYARNALRMAALMKLRCLFVYTHDSIGLGEDGPTHQAVEQTASLRLIPNMSVWRPCDAVESAVAWKLGIERTGGPTSLLFSRQTLPHQARTAEQIAAISRGGYILREPDQAVDAIAIATGSEVDLAMQAALQLQTGGVGVRVVSMPSTDVFEQQDAAYRESVLPASVTARIAIEAGVTDGWYRHVGSHGRVVGIDTFGESAPYQDVYEHFDLTVKRAVEVIEDMLAALR